VTTRPNIDDQLLDEAISWHRALDGDDADWDGFTLWLEADPRHRQAFDEIALTDRVVEDLKPSLRQILPATAQTERTGWFQRRRLLIGSIAAALALVVGIPALWPGPADTVYATTGGETRSIALAGGTSIDLAPSSRLIVKASDPSTLELVNGEAYFAVAHDPRRTLSIRAGSYAVTDIGTKFGMNLADDTLTVGVSEGHVAIAAAGSEPAKVAAGEQLIAQNDAKSIRKSTIAAKDVGSWRLGRLVYNDAPLSMVAADITRYSGKMIIMDPALRNRRFSGVLAIGDGSKLLANLAGLMALSYRVEGDRIRISTAGGR
jgi:transmembrane sensor